MMTRFDKDEVNDVMMDFCFLFYRSGRSSRREEPLLETPESGHGSEIEISMEQMSPNTVGENHHNLHHRSGGGRDGHEVIEVQILPQVCIPN